MGKIYCLIGKSASGKDTVYRKITELRPDLGSYVMYTTRQMRDGEIQGKNYFFVNEDRLKHFEEEGKLIESRTYSTVYGPWIYATVDDGQIDLGKRDYIMTGTLQSFEALKGFYGSENVVPVYIELDDGVRLQRALNREMSGEHPKYKELCRRFIADCDDFSDDKIKAAGIVKRFYNDDLNKCVDEIIKTFGL